VHKLLMFCISEGDKFFIYIHLGSLSRKKVGEVHITDGQHRCVYPYNSITIL